MANSPESILINPIQLLMVLKEINNVKHKCSRLSDDFLHGNGRFLGLDLVGSEQWRHVRHPTGRDTQPLKGFECSSGMAEGQLKIPKDTAK